MNVALCPVSNPVNPWNLPSEMIEVAIPCIAIQEYKEIILWSSWFTFLGGKPVENKYTYEDY
jgi:hypothetical protein